MKHPPNPMTRGRLTTRHIVLLVRLDEHRSVLRAAQAAHMTQPGASKLLADLEHSLGVQLFERHARGVEPTAYGEIMMRHARAALMEMDRAQQEIEALQSGLTGECSIGAVVSAGSSVVAAAIALLKQRHPGVLVRTEVDNSVVLVDRLLKGNLDIMVGRIPGSRAAGDLIFERLAGGMHRVVARAAHPLAEKTRLDLHQLVEQPWILPPRDSLLRNQIDAMFVQRGLVPPRNLVESQSIPVIISLLQRTDMVSALQDETIEPYLKAGLLKVLHLSLGVEIDPYGIVRRRDYQLSPSAEVMLKTLYEAAELLHPKTGPRRPDRRPRRP